MEFFKTLIKVAVTILIIVLSFYFGFGFIIGVLIGMVMMGYLLIFPSEIGYYIITTLIGSENNATLIRIIKESGEHEQEINNRLRVKYGKEKN